jgi:hypothetical protein
MFETARAFDGFLIPERVCIIPALSAVVIEGKRSLRVKFFQGVEGHS